MPGGIRGGSRPVGRLVGTMTPRPTCPTLSHLVPPLRRLPTPRVPGGCPTCPTFCARPREGERLFSPTSILGGTGGTGGTNPSGARLSADRLGGTLIGEGGTGGT